jgi:hypothetical protein
MPIVRRSRSDIDRKALLAELVARLQPTEPEIDRQAVEDANAWTEKDVARTVLVQSATNCRAGATIKQSPWTESVQFARRFGFTADTVQQYEQGRRVSSGPDLDVVAGDQGRPGGHHPRSRSAHRAAKSVKG